MDTPDRAHGFADATISDAVNKEWLLASSRSSQLSADLRRYQLNCSFSNSWSMNSATNTIHYGAMTTKATSSGAQQQHQQLPPLNVDNDNPVTNYLDKSNNPASAESSWLLRHYYYSKNNNQLDRIKRVRNLNSKFSINNNQLYDDISFGDSPLLARSLSACKKNLRRYGNSESINFRNHDDDECVDLFDGSKPGFCFGKFRILLACYLLLGITLAIYSRNALSLAAVGMVANNEVNNELVSIMVLNGPQENNNNSSLINGGGFFKRVEDALDGSCPIVHNSFTPEFNLNRFKLGDEMSNSTSGGGTKLETKFKTSIKERIEKGELVDWSPGEQGLIFAAGSVGNLLIAIPLTRLGEIYGSKWIISLALIGATIQAALMPIISTCHISLIILFQIIFNGLTYGADCAAYTLFVNWLTPTEMAFFVSCLLICYQTGNIINSIITASILTNGIAWSWCFYSPAILCGIWSFIWIFIGASEPSKSLLVSKREVNYLLKYSKMSQAVQEHEGKDQQQKANNNNLLDASKSISINGDSDDKKQQLMNKHSVSWLKLAKDPNIWAIISVKFTLRWYFSVYASLMPTYLSSIAHMSIRTIGNMSVIQSFVSLSTGILMSYLTKSCLLKRPFNISLAVFRKICQSIVNFGLALSLLVFIIFDCNQWVTIIALTISGICINFYVAAALQLPLDLSPNHCGLITSITNTLALGQSIGAPISGLILNDGPKNRSLWRIVWGMSVLLNTISGLLFILLVDSKPKDYSKDSTLIHENEDENSRENLNYRRESR